MYVKRRLPRFLLFALIGLAFGAAGPAHALPDPQAVEDAALVVIARPDEKIASGYRVEEVLLRDGTTQVGDLLLLPKLRVDTPSEDALQAAARLKPTFRALAQQTPRDAFPEAPLVPSTIVVPPRPQPSQKTPPATPAPTASPAAPAAPGNSGPGNSGSSAFPEAPPPPSTGMWTPIKPMPSVEVEAVPVPSPNSNSAPSAEPSPANPTPAPSPTPLPTPPPASVMPLWPQTPKALGAEAPLSPAARVLLFLWYAPDSPGHYSVTQGGRAFAWVSDVANVEKLRVQGHTLLDARRDWQRALRIDDPKARLTALWPFLGGYDGRYNALAQIQFALIGPPAGNFLAARWKNTDSSVRMSLLPTLASYHSAALHRALEEHLQSLQRRYEVFLAAQPPEVRDRADDWNTLPDEMKAVYGELYYGVVGLTGFKDRSDLPMIRQLALWSLKYRFKQTSDAALSAFKAMPADGNLTIIADIWREYSTRPIPGNELSPLEVIKTLDAHRLPATVPLLAVFLRNPNPQAVAAARASMRRIVGRDLGTNPMAWLKWYQSKAKNMTR